MSTREELKALRAADRRKQNWIHIGEYLLLAFC
jgi:hypothetical protein